MSASSAASCGQPTTSMSTSCAGGMRRSTDATLSRLLSGIERELPHAVELRHRLHRHPELSHAEDWTAATIAQELPVESVVAAGTGRLARIGPAAGPLIGVRAELDGLPLAERTG